MRQKSSLRIIDANDELGPMTVSRKQMLESQSLGQTGRPWDTAGDNLHSPSQLARCGPTVPASGSPGPNLLNSLEPEPHPANDQSGGCAQDEIAILLREANESFELP